MKDFLIKLKLIDYLTIHLSISKAKFIERLLLITDQRDTVFFSGLSNAFSSSKNEFKGEIKNDEFKLKRRTRLFDTSMNAAVANGKLHETEGQLTIEAEIKSFNNLYVIYYVFLVIFYSIFIIVFMFSNSDMLLIIIPFILLHGAMMSLVPYFFMRRSVKKLKYELEREFFYLTKDN
jgi:hypothetical protein